MAQILKDNGAIVRGGPEQGQQLMEALVVGCMHCCIMLALANRNTLCMSLCMSKDRTHTPKARVCKVPGKVQFGLMR